MSHVADPGRLLVSMLLLASGSTMLPACTVITDDAYQYRLGDTGSSGDGGADGGGTDSGCSDPLAWYADDDGDGLGDPDDRTDACVQPDGTVDNADDCDDDDATVGLGDTWYLDDDDDGYGVEGQTTVACEQPDGYAATFGDCADDDAAINPDATETCSTAADDDCDGETNVQDAADCIDFYLDGDGDGYGFDLDDSQCWCEPTGDYVGELLGDCDDGAADVNPGQPEVCFDGLDNNCDGQGCRIDDTWGNDEAELIGTGESGSNAGDRVAFLGDVDGDGLADVGVGAPLAGNRGAAYVVLGGGSGPISLPFTANGIASGVSNNDVAGRGVAGLPDVDGDGLAELVVGAPGNDTAVTDAGAVYVVYGPAIGNYSLATADVVLVDSSTYNYSGRSVATLLDGTGDSRPDLLIGAANDDSSGNNAGAVSLLPGPFSSGSYADARVAFITGAAAGDQAGRAVAAAGDVDGDGTGDLFIGALYNDDAGNNAGAAYVVLGGTTGVSSVDDADATMLGEAAGDLAGVSLAGAMDVNGDGNTDLVVGAEGSDTTANNAGTVYVVLGPVDGMFDLGDTAKLFGEAADDFAGRSVASAGDMDGDGRSDLLVGAPGSDRGVEDGGAVYLVYGPPAFGTFLSDADLIIEGQDGGLGASVAGGLDYDGDGQPDIVAGAPQADGDAGQVLLFLGGGL